jgi:hypothetical protein
VIDIACELIPERDGGHKQCDGIRKLEEWPWSDRRKEIHALLHERGSVHLENAVANGGLRMREHSEFDDADPQDHADRRGPARGARVSGPERSKDGHPRANRGGSGSDVQQRPGVVAEKRPILNDQPDERRRHRARRHDPPPPRKTAEQHPHHDACDGTAKLCGDTPGRAPSALLGNDGNAVHRDAKLSIVARARRERGADGHREHRPCSCTRRQDDGQCVAVGHHKPVAGLSAIDRPGQQYRVGHRRPRRFDVEFQAVRPGPIEVWHLQPDAASRPVVRVLPVFIKLGRIETAVREPRARPVHPTALVNRAGIGSRRTDGHDQPEQRAGDDAGSDGDSKNAEPRSGKRPQDNGASHRPRSRLELTGPCQRLPARDIPRTTIVDGVSPLQIANRRERMAVRLADVVLQPLAWLPRRSPEVRRILLLRLERIGDLLMTIEAIDEVRRTWPHARIDLAVGSWNESIAKLISGLAGVHIVDVPWLSRGERPASWGALVRAAGGWRRLGYDMVINFEPDIRSNFLAWLSGAPVRVGYASGGGGALLTLIGDYDPTQHVSDNARTLVARAAGRVPGPRPPRTGPLLTPTPAQAARAATVLNAAASPIVEAVASRSLCSRRTSHRSGNIGDDRPDRQRIGSRDGR